MFEYNESLTSIAKIETESIVNKITFSYTNENIIASCSDSEVSIWDLRKFDKSLKSNEFNDDSRSLNLEFDRQTGLLLH